MTFTEFFQSIDWTPLERRGILHFRTKHYLGWSVAKLGDQYEATRRAFDAIDEPACQTKFLQEMARWLFGYEAYPDGVYDPEKETSAEALAQKYLRLRGQLYDTLSHSQPETVTGPAKVLALIYKQPGSFFDFEYHQLHPGEVFTGQCAVWGIGDYD